MCTARGAFGKKDRVVRDVRYSGVTMLRLLTDAPVEAILVVVVAVAASGAGVGIWLSRAWASWRARRRTRRGFRGEKVALRLLTKRGYTIVDTQATARSSILVDGEVRAFEVRADAIVEYRRRRYVAEFKTGRAASVGNRSTRRQLLEYALTYDADGVLLVDATQGSVMRVEFPAVSGERSGR